jgi:hypothetical protein
MNYWSDLFTPETYEGFSKSDRRISGFRESQRTMAEKVQPGDKFICYMVRMSRWIGVLEVLRGRFSTRSQSSFQMTTRSLFDLKSSRWFGYHRSRPSPSAIRTSSRI